VAYSPPCSSQSLPLPILAASGKDVFGVADHAGPKTSLLAEQPKRLHFAKASEGAKTITIDDSTKFQTMDGFGHALTGGTAQLMMKMSPAARTALLKELFGDGPGEIAKQATSVCRWVASDMNDHVYTYDDMPAGQDRR